MKTVQIQKYLVLLFLALGLVVGPILRAEDPPPAPVQPAVAVAAPVDPAVTPAEAEKPETNAEESVAAEATPAVAAEPADADDKMAAAEEGNDEATTGTEQDSAPENAQHDGSTKRHSSGNERVSFGSNSTLAAGEQAQAVVSIFGSSSSAGEVSDAVVSIMGSSRVTGGTVGNAVVSVLGNTYVNGHVKGEVVAVLGNVELGPDALVEGEVVCVGGQITRDAKAVVKGNVQNIAVAGKNFNFDSLSAWFSQCVLYARPLAFDGRLLWAWCVAFAFLAFYVLIALIAPAGVVKCAETLEQRPGYSLLAALLTLLLTPVAYILLALTLAIAIGFVLIPLFSLGLFFAAIFGKIVMLAWAGRRFTKLMGGGPLAHPAFGVLLGGLVVLGLYTIPVAGFIIYKLIGILGLGVVVYTLILQFKSSRPPKPAIVAVAAGVAGIAPAFDASSAVPPLVSPVTAAAILPVISAATLSRAGFWHRIAAAALDAVMVGIVFGMLHSIWHGFGGVFPFWYAVYCIAFWATKSTTIGGIICGLKLVRLDDRPVDWSVAIVRALGAFLSLAVAGLGFIWVAFDDEKQSWHDKIAGTTIVKVPKGTALL